MRGKHKNCCLKLIVHHFTWANCDVCMPNKLTMRCVYNATTRSGCWWGYHSTAARQEFLWRRTQTNFLLYLMQNQIASLPSRVRSRLNNISVVLVSRINTRLLRQYILYLVNNTIFSDLNHVYMFCPVSRLTVGRFVRKNKYLYAI